MVESIPSCIANYSTYMASWLITPLAFIFFIILLTGFVGYFAMKRSIYGAIIFQLIAMIMMMFVIEGILLVFT